MEPQYIKEAEKQNELFRESRSVQAELSAIKDKILEATEKIRRMEQGSLEHTITQLENMKWFVEELKKREKMMEKQLSQSYELEDVAKRSLNLQKAENSVRAKQPFQIKKIGDLISHFNYAELHQWGKKYYWANLVNQTMGNLGAKGIIIAELAKQIWKQFVMWDSAMTKFRMTMGLFRDDVEDTKMDAFDLAKSLADIGVTLEDIVKNTIILGAKFGGIHNVNTDLLKTLSAMEVSLGVSVENSSEVLRLFGAISKTTMASNKNVLLFTKSMANAAGIPLDVVMKDIASLSGDALALVSKMPLQLAKAAVEARRFGTSIAELSAAAGSTLDFSSSIAKEMDASVLLGRSINLQAAREAAYRGDMVEYLKQIRGIIKTTDFEALDFFQKKSVAEALGQSVDSLMEMSQSSREIDAALSGSNDRARKMAQEYQRLTNLNQQMVNDNAKNVEYQLQTKNNQERIASIQSKWNKLMMELGRVFLPIIDVTLGFVADHFNTIVGIGATIYAGWKLWNGAIGKTLNFFSKLRSGLASVAEFMGPMFKRFASGFGSMSEFFAGSRVLSFFGKVAGGLAKILVPLVFAWNIAKRFWAAWDKLGNMSYWQGVGYLFKELGKAVLDTLSWLTFGLSDLIIKGLSSAGGSILDAILWPFRQAWTWLKNTFIGQSPSELGLGIVKGIMSVQGMLMNALLWPFNKVLGALFGTSIQTKATAGNIGTSTIIPTPTASPSATANTSAASSAATNEDNWTSKLDKNNTLLQELVDLLKAGKIQTNTYLDSQLVSAVIARETTFRGGFGVNKVA